MHLDWSALVPEVAGFTEADAVAGAREFMLSIHVPESTAAVPNPLWTKVLGKAKEVAHERAAELVGRRLVGGKLKWSITETTRESLHDLVDKAIEEGWTNAELQKEILDSTDFAPSRALNISRTEKAYARSHGTHAAAKETGMKFKDWIPDDEACEVCIANADQGRIPIDEDFESGDDCVPAHPSDRCANRYYESESDEIADAAHSEFHKADDDGSWVTINGTHIHINTATGRVDKGPAFAIGHEPKQFHLARIRSELEAQGHTRDATSPYHMHIAATGTQYTSMVSPQGEKYQLRLGDHPGNPLNESVYVHDGSKAKDVERALQGRREALATHEREQEESRLLEHALQTTFNALPEEDRVAHFRSAGIKPGKNPLTYDTFQRGSAYAKPWAVQRALRAIDAAKKFAKSLWT